MTEMVAYLVSVFITAVKSISMPERNKFEEIQGLAQCLVRVRRFRVVPATVYDDGI